MEMAVASPEILDIPANTKIAETPQEEKVAAKPTDSSIIDVSQTTVENNTTPSEIIIEKVAIPVSNAPKISALSLASIRAKRELQEANKSFVKKEEQLPTEPFSETEMLLQWNKYAQRLGDKGQKIMESLILINDPKLEGTTIIHELPNEGSKIEFENEKNELQGYLRGKLHNHDIVIEVIVNESVENKFAFTAQDKYNRLNEINPTLDVLKKTFDLDI